MKTRDRTPRREDSGPSGHNQWIGLSPASTAHVALTCEWCTCRCGIRMACKWLQMAGASWGLRTQARTRNLRMTTRMRKPLHHLSDEPYAKRYGPYPDPLSALALSTHRASPMLDHAPCGARCVAAAEALALPHYTIPSPTTRAHPAGMPGLETAGRG